MNRVQAAFFSITPPAPPDDDGSYLRWHLLDHMPEQYSLPGVVLGSRWIADGEYADHVIAASEPFERVGGVVSYLFAEPVQQTYDDFMALGARLAEVGRFPERRPSLQTRLLALREAYASPRALVSAEVVPFRPNRGIVMLIEQVSDDLARWRTWEASQHLPLLLEADGVAGCWTFETSDEWTVLPSCEGEPQRVTVLYLDADPLQTSASLQPLIEQRWASGDLTPIYAAPLRSMISWEAWQ
ncbi:MAG TPA: hypothetical protein VHB69_12730 [Mycobacteriales bacterium]|nr:hypothetical protein [Mycobacteriales bacterium]